MDRMYLATDRVHVYLDVNAATCDQGLIDAFDAVAYPHAGMDNYTYKDVMYPGYIGNNGQVCIFLNAPLFKTPNGSERQAESAYSQR